MKTGQGLRLRLNLIAFLGVFMCFILGNLSAAGNLNKVIREAKKESQLISNEIETWLRQESGSILTPDQATRFRSRRSNQQSKGEKQPEKDLHAEGHHYVFRKHASKDVRNDAQLRRFQPVKSNSMAEFHRSKKKKLDLQAEKRYKGTFATSAKELSIKKVKAVVMEKRLPHSNDIQLKEKGSADIRKQKVTGASTLTGSQGHTENCKEKGTPKKVYQQPVKCIISSSQSAVKTNNLPPSSKTNEKGSKTRKSHGGQVHFKILSKKQKHILTMLQEMPREVLREYLNRKGLDKYWKVVENLTKISTGKHADKRLPGPMRAKLDKHNNKSFVHAKEKLNGEKPSWNKQALGLRRKVSQIMVHVDAVTERLKHPSTSNDNNVTTEKLEPRSKTHRNKKESHEYRHKKTAKQHSLSSSFHSKDKKKYRSKKVYTEHGNKLQVEMMQSNSRNRMQATKLSSTEVSLRSQTTPRKKPSKLKKSLRGSARKTSANGSEVLKIKNMSQLPVKAFKEKPTPNNVYKLVKVNDLSTGRQQRKNTIKQEGKTTTTRRLSKTMQANDKSKEITQTSSGNHVITSKQSHQVATYDNSSTQPKHPALSKLDYLKEKIRKTNNLKFKVAQALLAHCETQNRLRRVFDEVNSSLRKAALLARAIGKTFGIKEDDIMKMKSEHTELAVEQFLNQLF